MPEADQQESAVETPKTATPASCCGTGAAGAKQAQ